MSKSQNSNLGYREINPKLIKELGPISNNAPSLGGGREVITEEKTEQMFNSLGDTMDFVIERLKLQE